MHDQTNADFAEGIEALRSKMVGEQNTLDDACLQLALEGGTYELMNRLMDYRDAHRDRLMVRIAQLLPPPAPDVPAHVPPIEARYAPPPQETVPMEAYGAYQPEEIFSMPRVVQGQRRA